MNEKRWHPFESVALLQENLAEKICALGNTCIKEKNIFSVVLAGGETPRGIYARLSHCNSDWSRWHIYFSDERCLPAGHPDRNDSMARSVWLDHVAIPAQNIHAIPAHPSTKESISQYNQTLAHIDTFDLVLLGLGEDGHTASLFPGHDWGTDEHATATLAVNNAPKPPPQRISMSARRLSSSRQLWFIVTGKHKQDAVAHWQRGDNIPAASIQPAAGVDIFIAV